MAARGRGAREDQGGGVRGRGRAPRPVARLMARPLSPRGGAATAKRGRVRGGVAEARPRPSPLPPSHTHSPLLRMPAPPRPTSRRAWIGARARWGSLRGRGRDGIACKLALPPSSALFCLLAGAAAAMLLSGRTARLDVTRLPAVARRARRAVAPVRAASAGDSEERPPFGWGVATASYQVGGRESGGERGRSWLERGRRCHLSRSRAASQKAGAAPRSGTRSPTPRAKPRAARRGTSPTISTTCGPTTSP